MPGVVDVVVPGLDQRPLAVAAAVADRVHGVHRVPVCDEPAGQGVVQPEVLAVAVQQHDGAAVVAVRAATGGGRSGPAADEK